MGTSERDRHQVDASHGGVDMAIAVTVRDWKAIPRESRVKHLQEMAARMASWLDHIIDEGEDDV